MKLSGSGELYKQGTNPAGLPLRRAAGFVKLDRLLKAKLMK
ncbi:hypothetical protein SD77_2503 [Bacillus badius]|uniref:Uncharacterized protein n=1 Tax=Bacillus badius TaxID=1455 RepID=A0ABR5AZD5_BACBA|nr:hypothetical protein SD77_2503 [Bacillus badius]